MKHLRPAAAGAAGLLVITMGVAFWFASSGRLADRARARIVAEIEHSTGGRAEIGAFRFDWQTLTVAIDRLVIHGTEPATAKPLFSADHIRIRLQIASFLRHRVQLTAIHLDRPQTHLMVDANGRTNVPALRERPNAGLQQLLNLRIGRFVVSNGLFLAESSAGSVSREWSATGEDLVANASYRADRPRYAGSIAIRSLRLTDGAFGSFELNANARVELEQNRITLPAATLRTKQSELAVSNFVLADFHAPVITSAYQAHVSLADFSRRRGTVESSGDLRFSSLSEYAVHGTVRGQDLDIANFANARGSARFDAAPGRIVFSDLHARVADGEIAGSGEVRNMRDFRFDGHLEHVESRRLVAMIMHRDAPYAAVVSGPVQASGRVSELAKGRINAIARLQVTPARCAGCMPVQGHLQVTYAGAAGTVEFGPSSLSLPSTHIDFSGVPGHELKVNAQTCDLADLRPAIGSVPIDLHAGDATFSGTLSGPLNNPSLAGHVTVNHATVNAQELDAFSGDITASSSSLSVQRGIISEGSLRLRLSGSIALVKGQPGPQSAVDATAQASGADVKRLLAIAGEKNVDFSGTGTAGARIAGTLSDPHVNAVVSLTHGSVYGQPYDSLTSHLQYSGAGGQLFDVAFVSGAKRMSASGRFDHPAGAPPLTGSITFRAQSNTMALNQIALIRSRQPDLLGAAQFHADGSARVSRNGRDELVFDLLGVNGEASVSGIELAGRSLGDARLTAATTNNVLTVRFDSNAARASIHGSGTVALERDYPASVSVTFSRAGLNALAMLIVTPARAQQFNIDGTAAGELSLRGPARDWTRMTGELSLPELELYPASVANCGAESTCAGLRTFRLQNSGAVRLAIANGIVAVENARFTGPETDVSVTGTMGFTERTGYNLRAAGDVNLAVASTFTPDFATSGTAHIDAAVRGVLNAPDLSGRIQIRNGAARYTGFANGITGVNASLLFSGDRATIQSFTGESGGGRVQVGGFVALTGGVMSFRLETQTTGVRLRFSEGASIISDSRITVAGTSDRSEASGAVVIHRLTVNPRADLSNIFARTAQPVKTATVQAGPLSKLNLDVQIETAPDIALETSVAQRIQADASLRLRGTATNPALLGRINITSGELMFFSNKYSITQGSVSFLNPARIDPILNIDLETRARGVDVIITIAGPLTKPGVSYRSDPPLQFSDIVALLATGRSPLDPGLPSGTVGQQQAFAQLGASQMIGEAIANPSNSRLQRFFGVSKVKIDPQLSDVTGSPESRLTVEQQVSPDILFTYITDVANTSTQLIRVEWAFNRHWSAIVTREENGYVGLDFAYRKRFK